MSARRCSECPKPVGLWRRHTCTSACGAVRARRVKREGMRQARALAARVHRYRASRTAARRAEVA